MAKSSTSHLDCGRENEIIGITVADDTRWALSSLAQQIAIHRRSLSDTRIFCKGACFKVHRKVLSSHSAVLQQLCEASVGERGHLTLHLDDEPLVAVKAVVDYFYSLRYQLPKRESNCAACLFSDKHSLPSVVHADVFQLAVRYDLSHLADLAITRFVGDMNIHASGLFSFRNPCYGTATITHLQFFGIARYVYNLAPTEPSRLRYGLVRALLSPPAASRKAEDIHLRWPGSGGWKFWTRSHLDEVLQALPELASDLLTVITGRSDHGRRDIAVQDLRIAIVCGKATVEEMRAIGDPPPDVLLADNAEEWLSETEDEKVFAEMVESELHVGDSVQSNLDLVRDSEPSDYDVDCEMEDIAAEVMGMVYEAEYDVRAEAKGRDDPPRDLYLGESAMECEIDDDALEVMDMIYGHCEGCASSKWL